MEEVNIKVICRFRPLNESEQKRGSELCMEFISDTSLKIPNDNPTTQYTFDKVFQPSCSQSEIYNISARPIVESVMHGFNGTVFAYGQTSSGKTFTMMGAGPGNKELKGIIPRMVETVFSTIHSSVDSCEFVLKISYCEIYLEKIKDLIDPKKVNLKIHENKTTGVYIDGLTECGVGSEQDVYDLMTLGTNNREVAFTNMNAGSSRSHSLFILTVNQTNTKDLSSKKGKLFLVDLAGSEKVGKTGAAGMRLEEAKNINKSLTVLGLVINNLTDGKSSHIPYRDSKLTRILQDSLGGNSKTSLIITCSPSPFNEAETVSTLKFGLRAKSIKNKAKVNREFTVAELKLMLAKSQEELEGKNMVIKNLEARLKGELGVDFVMPNVSVNKIDTEEIMSEIEEYKEKISSLSESKEKLLLDNKILESEVRNLEKNQDKLEDSNRLLNENVEILEDKLKENESLIEIHLMVKEKLEKDKEELLKKVLDTEKESRNKSEVINKLKQELNKKDFVPQRAISMSFALKPVVSPESEEIDMLYEKVASLSSSLKESQEKELDLVKTYEAKLSSKNSEMKALYDSIENLKKEKSELNNYSKQLEKNHKESLKNLQLSTEEKLKQSEELFKVKLEHERSLWLEEKAELNNLIKQFEFNHEASMKDSHASSEEKIKQNEEFMKVKLEHERSLWLKEKAGLESYIQELELNHQESAKNSQRLAEEKARQSEELFRVKLEHERSLWLKEKDDIMNDLNNRIERVIQLEMAIDNQKDFINNVQRRMSIQDKETFSNTLDLQNQIQDLNFALMKEKNAFDELKINLEVTQNKLLEKKLSNKKFKQEVQELKDRLELLAEKNKVYEETVKPCENFNPRRSMAFNIQKVIVGGSMINDPRRQSIMIKKAGP